MCQIDRKAALQLAGGGGGKERGGRKKQKAVLLMTGREDCKDHSHSGRGQGRGGVEGGGEADGRSRRELVRRCKHTDQANLPALIQCDAVFINNGHLAEVCAEGEEAAVTSPTSTPPPLGPSSFLLNPNSETQH